MKKLLLFIALLSLSNISFAQKTALTETFDGATFPPTGWVLVKTNVTANKSWLRIPAPYSINGDGSAFIDYDSDHPSDESLISPSFSLVGYTSARLNFTASLGYYWMVTQAHANLFAKVSIDGGDTWTKVWVEEDLGQFDQRDPNNIVPTLLDIQTDLTPYIGQSDVMIKFEYVGQDGDFVLLDDVSVTEGCPAVNNVALVDDSISDTTFSVSWRGYGSTYDFEWGPTGFIQGEGNLTENQTAATFDLVELSPGTGYDFYIKSDCYGIWQGPFTVYTTLSTPADLNYSYGFESGPLYAAGWFASADNNTYPGQWNQFEADAPSPYIQEGTHAVECSGTDVDNNAWLFSRGINLKGGTTVTISYYLKKVIYAGTGGVNSVNVFIGTEQTDVAQTDPIGSFDDFKPEVFTPETFTYHVPADGVYYLGFNNVSLAQTSTDSGTIILDAVSVTENLSVNDFISSKFDFYPNPVKDIISISNSERLTVNAITVSDLNGRVIRNVNFNNVTDLQMNVSDLASGMYMLTISTDKGIGVKKMMKQ